MPSPQPYISTNNDFAPSPDNLRKIVITVTSNDILNLYSTPITVIPAPGVGKFISVLRSYIQYNYGTATYTQPGNTNLSCGSNNFLQYGNFLAGVADKTFATFPSTYTMTENTAVELVNTVSDPTVGDGDFTLTVYYLELDSAL